MCGRYTLLADELEMRQAFGIEHSIVQEGLQDKIRGDSAGT